MPFVSTSQDSSPTGICSRLPEVDLWEPYDGRLSRTVLREPGGEIPPGYSPDPNMSQESAEFVQREVSIRSPLIPLLVLSRYRTSVHESSSELGRVPRMLGRGCGRSTGCLSDMF